MNKKRYRLLYSIFSITIFSVIMFSAPFSARALVGSDVIAEITPEIPGPNEQVTIRLTSYAIDLNSSLITWKIGGKTVLSKNGAVSYTLSSGASGSRTTVEATIVFRGSTLVKTILIEPSTIDLIWEAVDSYTPPFYKGKALPSSEAVIKIVGIPDMKSGGIKLSKNDLTFSWERNFSALPVFSGYAKDSFIFKTSYLNTTETISLKASSINGGLSAQKISTIRTSSPFIVFYEYSPLAGVNYKKNLGEYFSLTKDEATIVAEPYFFSPKDALSNDLDYEWKINGTRIANQYPKNTLVVRKPAGASGNAFIDLSIESKPRLFQSADKTLNINL